MNEREALKICREALESIESMGGYAVTNIASAALAATADIDPVRIDPIQREAEIRLRLARLRAAEDFEARVLGLKALIEQGHEFDWPFTSAFDDGGAAYHEAKRRIAAAPPTK